MLKVFFGFAEIPFSTAHPFVHLYAVSRFEALRIHSLGKSRLIKECVPRSLEDNSLKTEFVKSSQCAPKPFKEIREIVLRCPS